MKVWWCEAMGEGWDLELHNERPCDVAFRRYGVGGATDDKEHALCGERLIVFPTPAGYLVYGEFIPYDILWKHQPFAAPTDQVVALYAEEET